MLEGVIPAARLLAMALRPTLSCVSCLVSRATDDENIMAMNRNTNRLMEKTTSDYSTCTEVAVVLRSLVAVVYL